MVIQRAPRFLYATDVRLVGCGLMVARPRGPRRAVVRRGRARPVERPTRRDPRLAHSPPRPAAAWHDTRARVATVTAPSKPKATTAVPPAAKVAEPASPPPAAPAPAPGPKKDLPRTMRDLRLATESKRRASAAKTLENPLREGLRLERVPDPAIFVLFGATGDLVAPQGAARAVPALADPPAAARVHGRRASAGGRTRTRRSATELKESLDKYSRVQPVDRRPGTTSPSGSSTTAATSPTR